MLMFLRMFIFLCLASLGPIGVCQEGYRYGSIGFGSSVSSLNHQVLSISYEELLANGDGWEYGLNWFRKNDLHLQDPRIRSGFEYEGDLDIRLDSKSKKYQSFTINANYNRRFHQWKNAFLISHFGIGLGGSRFMLILDGDQLDFSSFQFGPNVGASYQQFLTNRLCVFMRFSTGVYWRVKLPPFYPASLQIGFKVPI